MSGNEVLKGMCIGDVVAMLRTGGYRARRPGWNGKNMWLAYQAPDTNSKMTLPYIYMKTSDGGLVPWLCSQTDLLAQDWEIFCDE